MNEPEKENKTAKARSFRAAGFSLAGGLLLLSAAAALIFSPAACVGKSGNGFNVIVLLVDTLRTDHLGCFGYERATSPNLDRFAEGAVAFAANYSQSSRTGPSVASFFTGLNVRTHGVLNPLDQWDGKGVLALSHTTLAEVLSDAGYRCRAIVSNPNVYAPYGFGQGFEDYRHAPIFTDAGPINTLAAEWIEEEGDRPFFLYLHYMEPHSPYAAPSVWNRHFVDPDYRGSITGEHAQLDAILAGQLKTTPADERRLVDLYDQEIVSWDREFGRLWGFLKGRGLLDNTVVIVLSDHGEEFFEHGGVLHGYTLYEEQLRVPLLVAAPGLAPGAVKSVTRNIDVFPTLLDLLDLPTPEFVQGRTLRALMEGGKEEDREVLSETRIRAVRTTHVRALRARGGLKIIETLVPGGASPELFRLTVDPAEKNNLHGSDPELGSLLREVMKNLLELIPEGESSTVTLDEEALEQLRGMGYVGGRESKKAGETGGAREEN
jgi:arylsulfatase A-like enzyme